MNLKNPFLSIAAVFIVALFVYSCRKEYSGGADVNPKVEWAKDYFTESLLPNEGNAVGANLLPSSQLSASQARRNMKTPIWQKAMDGRSANYEFAEVPLRYNTKVTSLLSVKNSNDPSQKIADKGVLKASFDRLIIYKNRKGKIQQRIVSFVPSREYVARHNGDISHNRINKLDKDFEGTLIYRNWDDTFLFALVIKKGKAVKKLDLTKQIKFRKAAFRTETCVEIEIYNWYQYCFYSADRPDPDYCDEPFSEYVGSYWVCTYEPDEDPDPCLDPGNFGTGECGDGGGDDGPPSTRAVKNNVKDSCLNDQVDNAINAKTAIAGLLWEEFGGTVQYYDPDINFRDTTNLPANIDGEAQKLSGMEFEIRLNQNTLPNTSKEYMISTVYHEILHVYFSANFNKDANGNVILGDGHDEMADNYLAMLAGALQHHSPGLPDREAWALAWGGLEKTSFYTTKLSNNERTEIQAILTRHRSKTATNRLGNYCP